MKKMLSEITGIEIEKMPSYQLIGNVAILKFYPDIPYDEKIKISETLVKFPYIKTVCEMIGISDEFRTPEIKKLIGEDTVTMHKENGIIYKLDVSKIMFSKGNFSERKRISKIIGKDETVVDMFAGIGYFSLGLECRKIFAIEKNLESFNFLKENIKLNKKENIEPIFGDCRDFSFKADRIIMGYFPGTEKFLEHALKMKPKFIHFHNQYKDSLIWEKPLEDLRSKIKNFKIIDKKIIKSSGPRMSHVVLDIEVKK